MEVKIEVKDIMQVLKNLKKNCVDCGHCSDCKFWLYAKGCQLSSLASEFDWTPSNWDLEEIEWLLKQ